MDGLTAVKNAHTHFCRGTALRILSGSGYAQSRTRQNEVRKSRVVCKKNIGVEPSRTEFLYYIRKHTVVIHRECSNINIKITTCCNSNGNICILL
jgi:hypothetical protein